MSILKNIRLYFYNIEDRVFSGKRFLGVVYVTSALISLAAVVWACASRFSHIYLEDDFLWCLPLISQIKQTLPFAQMIHAFHSGELTLFDGLYFSALISIFGIHLKFYLMLSMLVHVGNAGLLFYLLYKRINLSLVTGFFAAVIYLTFYGHFHAYVRPISISHTMVVFIVLLLINLYLRIEERRNNRQPFGTLYGLVLVVVIIASVMRLSMVIAPIAIMVHILFVAKDGPDVWRKLRWWGPVFAILLIYDWILLTVIGREGRTLEGLMGFWRGIFHQSSWMLALLTYIGLMAMAGSVSYFFLKSRAAKGFLEIFKKIMPWTFFIPHFLLLSFFNWLMAVSSASEASPYQRWQLMAYPDGACFSVLLLVVLALMVMVVRYVRSRGAHLILFIGWYLSLLPFLGLKFAAVPSRYLVYVSPILAVVLSVFLFEILPQSFNFFRERFGRSIVLVGLCLIISLNIYAIHERLRRSILGDYCLSYDYVKVANVIKGDLASKGRLVDGHPMALCVQGVGAIEWWKDFLWEKFDKYSSFIWTLRSTIGHADISVRINDQCRKDDLVYRITDKTVVDGASRDIEPFYQFFNNGIARLRSGDFPSAYAELNKAFVHPPFIIRLFLNKDRLNQNFSVRELVDIAKTIKASYARSYTDDDRIRAIEYMVQKESMDYAFAVLLSAYLQDKYAYDTDRFWRARGATSFVASQWITADAVKEYPSQDYLPASEIKPFEAFAKHWLVPVENVSWSKVENYRGYAFYVVSGYYFAILDQYGDFDLAKFKRGGYASSHVVKTKHELRRWVDQQGTGGINSTFEAEDRLVTETLGQLKAPHKKTNFSLPVDVLSKYADASLLNRFEYGISVGGIPLGREILQATMEGGEQKRVRFVVDMKPWPWLQKVSKDSLGWRMTSIVDRNTLLPEFFEENVLSKVKKGKSGRKVVYHHDRLYMERKIYKEDILPDTRDLASLSFWFMARDYQDGQVVKTTMNISRNIYLIVGQVHDIAGQPHGGNIFRIDLRFIQMDHQFEALRSWSVEIFFMRMDGWSLPVLINIRNLPLAVSLRLIDIT